MKVTCLRPQELNSEQLDAWRSIQQAATAYDSPFFAPEFTLAVADVRPDVFVAVMEQEQPCGFFPFQVNSLGLGHAVGWRLNDFQGPIVRHGAEIDAHRLLRQCRMISFRFDHLVNDDNSFCQYIHTTMPSPCIDLNGGYDAYRESCSSESNIIKQTERKARKMARDIGDLRFVLDDTGGTAFDALLQLKAKQLREAGHFPIVERSWVRRLLEQLRETHTDNFSGQLSSLYAGNHLIAVHFGIRSRSVLHWWISSYDRDFERYSPGAILLARLAEQSAANGIRRIDLGKGSEHYKQRFMTGSAPVGVGTVTRWSFLHHCSRLGHEARRIVRRTPFQPTAKAAKRVVEVTCNWLTSTMGRNL